jgi:hypothetical protein
LGYLLLHHGALGVEDLALIKLGLDHLLICVACLVSACDGIFTVFQASHKYQSSNGLHFGDSVIWVEPTVQLAIGVLGGEP